MTGIDQIKQELQPGLSSLFKYEICYVKNLDEPILIILDYSPQNNEPLASFAFSLGEYDGGIFPPKCWMTHTELSPEYQDPPRLHEGYKKFSYEGNQFYPFSVNLSEYTPKDVTSIKNVINSLYGHIKF